MDIELSYIHDVITFPEHPIILLALYTLTLYIYTQYKTNSKLDNRKP